MITPIKLSFSSLMLLFCSQLLAQSPLTDAEVSFIQHETTQIRQFHDAGSLQANTRYLYPRFRELDARLTQHQTRTGELSRKEGQWHHQLKTALRMMDGNTPVPSLNSMYQVSAASGGTGVIRGRLRDAHSGELLSSMFVRLRNDAGLQVSTYLTDDAGRFLFTDLTPGSYLVEVSGNGYSTMFNGQVLCPGGLGFGCQLSDLNLLNLSAGQDLNNTDFDLLKGPKVTGRLLSQTTNEPISSVEVTVFRHSDGMYLASVRSDSEGIFNLALLDGEAVVLMFEHSTYMTELYDDIMCFSECDLSAGTVLNLQSDTVTDIGTGLLMPYGQVSGRVVDESTSQAIHNSDYPYVRIHSEQGEYVSTVSYYQMDQGQWEADFLAPGNYYIYASANNYLMELYDQQDCTSGTTDGCDQANGTLISHGFQATNGIDFTLQEMPETPTFITGRVFRPDGSPVDQSAYIRLYISSSSYYGVNTDEAGYYRFHGINPGTYHLIANHNDHHAVAYPGVPGCDSGSLNRCQEALSGSELVVTEQDHTLEFNLTLYDYATVSGQVMDDQNQPISNAYVRMDDQHGYEDFSTQTDINGSFVFTGVPQTEYTMYASASDFQSVAYDQLPCQSSNCSNDDKTVFQVNVATQQSGYDFNLPDLAQVNVNIITPVDQVDGRLIFYNPAGQIVSTASLYTSGEVSKVLPAGQYHLMFEADRWGQHQHPSRIYGAGNCYDTCDPTSGALIQVLAGQTRSVDLSLDENFKIFFQNTGDTSNVRVNFYDVTNDVFRWVNYYDPAQGPLYVPGLQDFKVEIIKSGFLSYYHDQIQCHGVQCGLASADLISPVVNQSMNISYDLPSAVIISGVLRNVDGMPISGQVQLLNSDGYRIRSYATAEDGTYRFTGVEPGTYYLKGVHSEHVDVVYAGLECQPDCDVTNDGTALVGEVGSVLTGIDLYLPRMGTIELQDVTLTNGELTGFRSITVQFIDVDDTTFYVSRNINNGYMSPVHLPPGRYVIKTNDASVIETGYPSVNCSQVNLADCISQSTIIQVNNGDQIVLDDFVLHIRGQIKGVVTDSVSGLPVSGHRVAYYDANHEYQDSSSTNHNGEYLLSDIDAGAYYLVLEAGRTHVGELYDDVDCFRGVGVDCLFSDGVMVHVSDDVTVSADFTPVSKPKLNVTVVDAIGLQVLNSDVRIYRDTLGDLVWNSRYERNHEFSLDPGNYYVTGYANYYNAKGHPGVDCDSTQIHTCQAGLQPITLSMGDDLNVRLGLDLLSGISGFVVDAVTGDPVPDVVIDVWRFGNPYRLATSNHLGGFSLQLNQSYDYQLSTDLPPGLPYYNEVYDNKHCFDGPAITGMCDSSLGAVVNINFDQGPTMVLFELDVDDIFTGSFD